jgi:hypothetical protein
VRPELVPVKCLRGGNLPGKRVAAPERVGEGAEAGDQDARARVAASFPGMVSIAWTAPAGMPGGASATMVANPRE